MIKYGDRVRVSNPKLKSHMAEGTVFGVDDVSDIALVALEHESQSIKIGKRNLVRIGEEEVKVKDAGEKFFAMLHMHDSDSNPSSMEEAWRDRDIWFLAEPQDTFYGTKEEIHQWITEHQEIGGFENAFVIIDSKIYDINTQVSLKGF